MAYSNECGVDNLDNEIDIYKETFKRFKNSTYGDIASSLIDFSDPTTFSNKTAELFQQNPSIEIPKCNTSHHFKSFDKWKAYTLKDAIDGIIVVPQILHEDYRSDWFDYFHRTFPRDKTQNLKANIELSELEFCNKVDFENLRWITFGYHHNWDTKQYVINQQQVQIPERVLDLTKVVSSYFNYNSFKPEAGIVNYYNRKSTLFFHTDHSELNHDAPLLSLSLGCPAIFLIGGLTKDSPIPIVPILLRDSDLLIMSKDSRLALHAIAKITTDEEMCSAKQLPNKRLKQTESSNKSKIYRINLNIRQVT